MASGFRFEVFGEVQGVFFRKYAKKRADELGLVGFVRNTSDSTVVGECHGAPDALQQMKEWLQFTGSPQSRIDRCEIQDSESKATFTEFRIER